MSGVNAPLTSIILSTSRKRLAGGMSSKLTFLCRAQYLPLGEVSKAPTLGLAPKGGFMLMQVKNGKLVKLLAPNVVSNV